MPKNVQLPDGRVVEFPDNMSDEQISAAIDVDQRSPVRRFVENAEDAILGTHTDEGVIKGFTEGLPQMFKHPIDSAKLLGSAALKSHEDAAKIGMDQMHEPGVIPKIVGGARYLTSGIPLIGPALVQAGEQMKSGDIAGGLGTTAGVGSMIAGPRIAEGAQAARPIIGRGLKKASYGMYNNVLGTKGSGLAFEGNPGRGVAQEGLVAGSRPRLLTKINSALATRGPQIDEVLGLPQNDAKVIDISEPVTKPFRETIRSGTKGALSDATLRRLSQTQRELTQERSAPGEYTGAPKNLSRLNPRDANAVKRDIQGRTNYQNPENDEIVNSTLRQSARGVRDVVNEAVPEVRPFNRRVQDLQGARSSLATRINRRLTNPDTTGFKDVAPAVLGAATGGLPTAASAIVGREILGSTPIKTGMAQGLYRLGNFLSPDAPLEIPAARVPQVAPVRGLLKASPIQLGAPMEPINPETGPLPPIDWTTRAVRTGRLLPERTSIDLGAHMEPIEDVGPMSQPAASVTQRNPKSGRMQRVYTTSSQVRPIQLPESPYSFGPDEEESEIERARRY